MSAIPEYVPNVTIQPGDSDDTVRTMWANFRAYRDEFAQLRHTYTERTPAPSRHDRCTLPPLTFARTEVRDETGALLGSESRPNLLSPTWWGDGRNAHTGSVIRPGFFPNETCESTEARVA
ncbi:hypothetical protein [Streptomyces sp. NPDC001089]